MTCYGLQAVNSTRTDQTYGSNSVGPDVCADELKRLCQEYLAHLQVHTKKDLLI